MVETVTTVMGWSFAVLLLLVGSIVPPMLFMDKLACTGREPFQNASSETDTVTTETIR